MPTHSRTESRKAAGADGASRSRHDLPESTQPLVEAPSKQLVEPLLLVHHHAGYLRIRADAFLQAADDPIVTGAREAAETAPGFRSWSLNPKTGSAVIQYEPGKIEADDLLKHIATRAGFSGVEVQTRTKINRQELVSEFLETVRTVNRVVDRLTGGRADLRELGPVALAAISVISFIMNDNRGRLPQWSSALYHSYRVFMHWHRPEIRTRERFGRQEDEREAAGDRIVDETLE